MAKEYWGRSPNLFFLYSEAKLEGNLEVHLDGNLYNNDPNNIAMLHIVDTMMLFTKRHLKEKELNVFLKSESLQDISVFVILLEEPERGSMCKLKRGAVQK